LLFLIALCSIATPAAAFNIFVTRAGASTITLNVQPSDSIENVRAKIETQTGVSPDRQTLSFSGTVLQDGRTLSDYNVLPGSTVNLVVSALPSTGDSAGSVANQTVNNAQAAIINGAQTLQTYNDWVTKGVMGSFGLTGSGTTATASVPPSKPEKPTARATLERLRREEQAVREELAGHPEGDTTLAGELRDVRLDLAYAHLAVGLEPALPHRDTRPPASLVPERERISSTQAAPALSLGTRDVLDYCDLDACDAFGKKWNVWLEGRVIGAVDSLAATNALGFVGSAGIDYKFLPWLAVGMSLGAEKFETRFGTLGVRSGTFGLTAMPYVGLRLNDNVFASIFAGASTIDYNNNPQPGVSATFTSLRFLLGGSLSGVWRDGPWRFQPTLSATYGAESQPGYTDSAGTLVAGQTLTYGRIGIGPEVGYTFTTGSSGWSIEPVVIAKANIDFASSNSSVLNGQSVVLRPGTLGSGSTGVGLNAHHDNGVYLRLQGSYDSIGVLGLDVWSGLLRAGMTF